MTTSKIFIGILFGVSLWLMLTAPYAARTVPRLASVWAVAAGVFLLGLLTSRVLSRFGRTGDGSVMAAAPLKSRRVLLVLLATIAFEVVVPRAFGSVWSIEAAYYVGLIASGVALALWCRAASYVPVVVAALALLAGATLEAAIFLSSPDVDFQYGPEKYLFALWDLAGTVGTMLPLDGVVCWFAWRLAGQLCTPSPWWGRTSRRFPAPEDAAR